MEIIPLDLIITYTNLQYVPLFDTKYLNGTDNGTILMKNCSSIKPMIMDSSVHTYTNNKKEQ